MASFGVAAGALAATAPGTPTQVAALVGAAPKITSLPSGLTPPLAKASGDVPLAAYPALAPCLSGKQTEPACVFGDTKATRTMLLFGDSHAYMWFPALDRIAKAARWRLVAWMSLGCPFADVTVWDVVTNGPNTACPGFRTHMLVRIDALHPSLVIVSESFYTLDADDQPITDAEWTTALEASFADLHGAGMKKVLIGDTYLVPDPITCLSAYPHAVQTCSRNWVTATYTAQRAADQKAAAEAKVVYVDEIPWTCSARCTVVVGHMIVYSSTGHLTTTYADYLSDVLKLALKGSMR